VDKEELITVNFGGRPLPNPDSDPRIFRMILQYCQLGHFSTIWLIYPEKSDLIFMKILPQM